MEQSCICSLGLAPECPAHPSKERRQKKPKPRYDVRSGACPACVVMGAREHEDDGSHMLAAYEVEQALTVGPVYCRVEALTDQVLVIRDARKKGGILKLQVLEGWFTSEQFQAIWMDGKFPARVTA